MFFKVWNNCKALQLKLFLLLSITLLDAILAVFSISLVLPIVDVAMGASGGEDSAWLFKHIPEQYKNDIYVLLYMLAGILFFKFLMSALKTILSIYFTENLRLSWQTRLSQKYITLPYKFIAQDRQGDVVNDLINETHVAAAFILNYLSYLSQIFITASIITLLFIVNALWIGSVLLLCSLIWFTIGQKYFSFAKRRGKRGIKLNQNLNAILIESLQGIKDIKISNSEIFQINKIVECAQKVNQNRKILACAQAIPAFSKDFLFAGIIILIAILMPADLGEIKELIPQLSLFFVAFAKLVSNITVISNLRFKVMSKFPSFVHIINKLAQDNRPSENLEQGTDIDVLGDHILIKDLGFYYNPDSPILNDLNLEIKKGEVICLSGPSGCGKTTLMDVLARLYDAQEGHITTEHGDITQFSLSSWRRLIGYVPQEPVMYHGTIRENITLGHDGIEDSDILEACKIAAIDDFIRDLPDGLDSMLHERGGNLSGGQKKRLALARAIAHKSALIIMDETTNAIQEQQERDIIQNIKEQCDVTLIIISHRENTMDIADKCYTIKDGKAQIIK